MFGLTDTVTVPLPMPESPQLIDIHGKSSVAAHEHAAPAVTVTFTENVPPAAAMFWLEGEIEMAHAAAAWVIVATRLPMVSVAIREPPVFAPTVNATAPLPVPDAPLVTTIHGALGVAVHAH